MSAGYAFASTDKDTLISVKRPATSSSYNRSFWCHDCTAQKAVDGNVRTRWVSANADRQWLQIDLGVGAIMHKVTLFWGGTYAKAYEVQVSNDSSTWTSLYATTSGTGGIENLTVAGQGRYIRLYAMERSTVYGFVLFELQVYGVPGSTTTTPTVEDTATAGITPTVGITPTAGITPTVGITPTAGITPTVESTATAPAGWHVIWNDEFNGATGIGPDGSKWVPDIGGDGWGNQEHEYYTHNDNAKQDGNGNLVIEVRKENPANYHCWYGTCQYTSARLTTLGKFDFTYGRVEARIKIPAGQGIWPAFWMMGNDINTAGWPNNGEVDIFENIGREPATVHGTVHGPGYSGGSGIGGPYSLSNGKFADDYHLFAVEWSADQVAFFVDGNKYFTVARATVEQHGKWIYNHPFYLLLNVAVGGNWPGDPDGSSTYPQRMYVDYVRVYQQG